MKHKHPKLESLRKSPEAIAGKDYKFSCSSALQSSKEQGQGQPFHSGSCCLLGVPLRSGRPNLIKFLPQSPTWGSLQLQQGWFVESTIIHHFLGFWVQQGRIVEDTIIHHFLGFWVQPGGSSLVRPRPPGQCCQLGTVTWFGSADPASSSG